jgi:hypothetical protein
MKLGLSLSEQLIPPANYHEGQILIPHIRVAMAG